MDMIEKSTGKLVPVPDEHVADAYRSGMFGIPQGGRLPVMTPGGTAGTVDPQEALHALAVGQRVATPQEIHGAQMESRYGGGLGNTLKAGGVGVLKGATEALGLPFEATAIPAAESFLGPSQEIDPITGKAHTMWGGDRAREALTALAALHPTATFAGQAAGTIGAMALGAEAGPLSKMGTLAESGAGLLGRGVAEGAAINLQQHLDEAALGDHELAAEGIIAALGQGALIGGGGAAAFGLLGKAFQRGEGGKFARQIRPEDVEALATREFGYAPKGLGDLYAKAASVASGGDREAIAKLMGSAEARRIAVYDSEAIQTEAARAIRAAGDEVLDASKAIADEAKGTLKADYVKRAIMKGNEEKVTQYAAQEIQKVIDGAQATLDAGGGHVKTIETVAAQAYRALQEATSGDNARAFIALDGLKRDIQGYTRNAYRGVQAIPGPVERNAARKTAEWLDSAGQSIRTGLEDEALFGKAALDQKTINEAWTKQIDASVRFHRSLTTEVGRDPLNPYLQAKGMDPSKVTTYVRGITNPDKDLTHQAVKDYLEGSKDLAAAIGKSYDLPPEKLAEIERLTHAADAFQKHIEKGTESLVLANQYQALKASDSPIGGALGLAGGLLGGPIGAAVGTAVGALTNPAKTVAQLAAIERLMSEVNARMDSGIDRFFSGTVPRGSSPSVKMLDGKNPREAFEASVRHVRELAADPARQSENIGRSIEPIASGAPRVATAVATRAAAMTQYLATVAPEMFTGNALDATKEKPIYSDTEMRNWARVAAVINDPDAITDSMARGTLTVEEVAAMKEHWPKNYAVMQEKIQTKLAKGGIKRSKRLVLSVLFDRPGDQDLDTGTVAIFQAAHAQGPSQGEKPMGRPLNVRLNKDYATPTSQIGGR